MSKSIFLFVAAITTYCLTAQQIDFKPVPNWVTQPEYEISSDVSKYDVNSGAYFELMDYQTNFINEADFVHEAIKILTYGGVKNASEIYISYDSSYQYIEFHYFYVWRNGIKIDRTQELSFELISNEQNLTNGIYSGLVTAYDIFEDIRVNDKIEYAYTIHGFNPIYDGLHYSSVSLEYDNPIDYLTARFLFPKDENYTYECQDCSAIKITKNTKDDIKEIHITRSNIGAVKLEETTPPWVIPFNYFLISNQKNWTEVKEWATDIFNIEEEQDLQEVFKEIFKGDETLDEKIDVILNYTQNDIRYMGIETGIGSIKPFAPSQVVKQRFGDCKDKTLLTTTLLNKIGIDTCYPALVSTSFQHTIRALPAGAQIFDHVILYMVHQGKTYWIDPTLPLQGGNYKTKIMENYGVALVLNGDKKGLTTIDSFDSFSKTEIQENFDITSFDEPAKLTVTTTLYGQKADYFRQLLEYYSLVEVSDYLKGIYARLFQNIEQLDKINIKDNLKENVLVITERYLIHNLWRAYSPDGKDEKIKMSYEPVNLYNYLSILECDKKSFPVYNVFPANYSQTTYFRLPEVMNIKPEIKESTNSAFTYTKETNALENGKVVKIHYNYISKIKEVSPEGFGSICNETNEIVRDLPLDFFYSKRYLDLLKKNK